MSHEGVADSLGPGADQVSAVPRLLEKVAALENSSFRSALGLPPKEKLDSPSAFKAALPILGISSEPTWTLKQTVDAIIAELELQVPTPATEKETSPAQLSMVSSSPSISTSDGVQVPKATSNKYRKAALAAEVRARSSSSKTQVTRTGARSDEPPWVSSSRSRSWGDDAHLDATVDGAHTTITRNTNGSRTASEARAAVDNLASLVTSLQGNCINTAPINRIASKASSTEDDLASLVSSSCAITTAGATATGTGSNISVVSGTGTGNPPYHLSKQQESTPGVPGQVSGPTLRACARSHSRSAHTGSAALGCRRPPLLPLGSRLARTLPSCPCSRLLTPPSRSLLPTARCCVVAVSLPAASSLRTLLVAPTLLLLLRRRCRPSTTRRSPRCPSTSKSRSMSCATSTI
jgi:hypothetical protein